MSTTDSVTLELTDDIAVIRIDDGKANALGHAAIDGLDAALDEARDARAVVLFGREGKFSAGFDLAVMKESPEAARMLMKKGAELCMRLYGFPAPVVAGSDGHALAAGALLLLSCDVRVASDNPGRIGLPETTIGMPLPVFATELARDRLSRRHFTAATLLGTVYSPDEALDVGYLDRIVPVAELEDTVMETARAHAAALSPSGFRITRANARRAMIDTVMASLEADMDALTVKISV
ncbi:MAG: crotonase/enoyl-CoA hydratase family protein [Acidimicrobiales bacterium]